MLPPSLQHFTFCNTHGIELTEFPPKLTHLSYEIFSVEQYNAFFPNTLTHLFLRTEHVPPVDFFPRNLKYLKLEGITSLHTPFPYMLPSLAHVKFGRAFNEPVDFLPHSITHLMFGAYFNQLVDHLPFSLKNLKFGSLFNHQVDHLPSSLTKLKFDASFNKSVDNLPPSLEQLVFGSDFNRQVDYLPSSLTHLIF